MLVTSNYSLFLDVFKIISEIIIVVLLGTIPVHQSFSVMTNQRKVLKYRYWLGKTWLSWTTAVCIHVSYLHLAWLFTYYFETELMLKNFNIPIP